MNLVIIVNLQQLALNEIVIWPLFIGQLVDVLEYSVHFSDFGRRANPQSTLRRFQTLSLDLFNLVDCVVSLLPPLQFFI